MQVSDSNFDDPKIKFDSYPSRKKNQYEMPTVLESLIEENAKLKKEKAKLLSVGLAIDDHNFRLAGRIMRGESKIDDLNLKIKELMQEIDTLRKQKTQLWEELVNRGCADFPTVDEHFDAVEKKINLTQGA